MPQSSLVNWLFSWKKPKATPRPVWDRFEPTVAERDRVALGGQAVSIIARLDELENDAAGKEARIGALERDLARLREEAGFA